MTTGALQALARLAGPARQAALSHRAAIAALLHPADAASGPPPTGAPTPTAPDASSPAVRLAALLEAQSAALTAGTRALLRALRHLCPARGADIKALAAHWVEGAGVPALACGFQYIAKKERLVMNVIQDSPTHPKRTSVRPATHAATSPQRRWRRPLLQDSCWDELK